MRILKIVGVSVLATVVLTACSETNKTSNMIVGQIPTGFNVATADTSGFIATNLSYKVTGQEIKVTCLNGYVPLDQMPGVGQENDAKTCNNVEGCLYSTITLWGTAPNVGSNALYGSDMKANIGQTGTYFSANNFDVVAQSSNYVTGSVCVPQSEVSYWS